MVLLCESGLGLGKNAGHSVLIRAAEVNYLGLLCGRHMHGWHARNLSLSGLLSCYLSLYAGCICVRLRSVCVGYICIYIHIFSIHACQGMNSSLLIYIYTYIRINTHEVVCTYVYIHHYKFIYCIHIHVYIHV